MKLPAIDVNPEVAGPAGQQAASLDDFVPGWRQVDSAMRGAGGATQDIYQGGEVAALAAQRAALASGEIGEAIQRLTDPVEKRYKQLDVSNQQVRAAQMHLAEAKYANDLLVHADPGDPNLVQKYTDGFDERYADIVNEASTPEGRLTMAHALAEARSQFGVHILTGQKELAGQKALQNVQDFINSKTELVRTNTAFAPQAMADASKFAETQAAMYGLSSAKRQEFVRGVQEKVALAALQGISRVKGGPELVEAQLSLTPDARNDLFKSLTPGIDSNIAHAALNEARAEISNRKREDAAAKHEAREQRAEVSKGQQNAIVNLIVNGKLTEAADKLRDSRFLGDEPSAKLHLASVIDAKIRGEDVERFNPTVVADAMANATVNTTTQDILKLVRTKDPSQSIGLRGMAHVEAYVDRLKTEQGRNVNHYQLATEKEVKSLFNKAFSYVGPDGRAAVDVTQYGKWQSYHYAAMQEGQERQIPPIQFVMKEWEGKPNPNWTGSGAAQFIPPPEKLARWRALMMRGSVKEAHSLIEGTGHDESVPLPPPTALRPQVAPPTLEFEDPIVAERKRKQDPYTPIHNAIFNTIDDLAARIAEVPEDDKAPIKSAVRALARKLTGKK